MGGNSVPTVYSKQVSFSPKVGGRWLALGGGCCLVEYILCIENYRKVSFLTSKTGTSCSPKNADNMVFLWDFQLVTTA